MVSILATALFLFVMSVDVHALTLEQRTEYERSMAEIDTKSITEYEKRSERYEIDLHYSHLKRKRDEYANTLSLSERIRFVCDWEKSEDYICTRLKEYD